MAEIHPTATVYDGTVLGEGVRVLENGVVGKQPSLGASSTAKREPVAPASMGAGARRRRLAGVAGRLTPRRAGAFAAGVHRGRHDRLDRRDRVRRLVGRREL